MAQPPNVATHYLCVTVCGAKCCRTAGSLRVLPAEIAGLKAAAKRAGVDPKFLHVAGDPRNLFAVVPVDGRICPMLDQQTNECRIYEDRPKACRIFPNSPIQGCLVWPGGDNDPHVLGPDHRRPS